jgi:hypothetical protein
VGPLDVTLGELLEAKGGRFEAMLAEWYSSDWRREIEREYGRDWKKLTANDFLDKAVADQARADQLDARVYELRQRQAELKEGLRELLEEKQADP